MSSIRNSTGIVLLALVILFSAAGCKSKKKAMEAAAEKARTEQEAAALKKQQEEEARMKQAEEAAQAKREADEKAARDAKAAAAAAVASTPAAKLNQYFSAISGATSPASANSTINEALSLFASADIPVLIVISESGGMKDYDKPTTIKTYLNYLKDQKKNINSIQNLVFDSSGKITEVELKKN
jgi:hypothetical protein